MTQVLAEDVWRKEMPHVLAALMRRFGDLSACEDAVQEAFIEASQQWPATGAPARPRGWLVRVASRRLIDAMRQDSSRREREFAALAETREAGAVESHIVDAHDASLEILALCCHPALTPDSQVTLALRAVLGLSTQQIAAVYFIPSATEGQRISRAKATIDAQHRRFPRPVSPSERLPAMLHALYLMYTVGHSRPVGRHLVDRELMQEAIRLSRLLDAEVPGESEAAGLLALMLLTEARRPARLSPNGDLVTLRDQDRGLWDRSMIAEGVELLERALPSGPVGAYQLQAAISAVHSEARTWEETDWSQIVELYSMLARVSPSPAVTMNFAVAVNEVHGPQLALSMLDPLLDDRRLSRNHRLHAVRAPMLDALGDRAAALDAYRIAARLCTSVPEQRYLNTQIVRLEAAASGET